MQKTGDEGSRESPQTGPILGAAGVAAVLASACCLGPLALAALGISAAGFSAAVEPLRPYFLALTVAFVGGGFYLVYFRAPACGPDGQCAVDRGRLRRSRVLLWMATVAVALVALFPAYAGSLLRAGSPEVTPVVSSPAETVRLRVRGMTCEACAASIERSLRAVPGVVSASVDYEKGEAVVATATGARPRSDELIRAVERAGAYEAAVAPGSGERSR